MKANSSFLDKFKSAATETFLWFVLILVVGAVMVGLAHFAEIFIGRIALLGILSFFLIVMVFITNLVKRL